MEMWMATNQPGENFSKCSLTMPGGRLAKALSTPQGCDSLINLQLTMTTLSASAQVIGNSLSASPSGANYQWIDCNNGNAAIPGATTQTYTPPSAGNYAVIVTTTNIVTQTAVNEPKHQRLRCKTACCDGAATRRSARGAPRTSGDDAADAGDGHAGA